MIKKLVLILVFAMACAMPASANIFNQEKAIAIMYHRLSDTDAADAFTIPAKSFEEDIKYLVGQGYIFCTASEFDSLIKSRNYSKIAAITFDDGYSSDLEVALPILEKYNAKATFFIIGELVGTDGYMNKEQIRQLSGSELVQIGNHSYFIHNIGYKNVQKFYLGSDCKAALDDFNMNKTMLEELTGKPINAVSYPYGIYGRYFDHLLRENGNVTFCSEEKLAKNAQPYGRFNRPADTTMERILDKAR